jgi:class 3 adenylate cyclase/predicted ATPase
MGTIRNVDQALKTLPSGTVTFLFTDIEGSTTLLKKLGDQYAQVLDQQRQILRNAFNTWGGQEVDTQGDAFFVAFPRASDAIAAAAQAQESMAEQAWPEEQEVRVRIGLHTGEASLTREGYVGLDVHRAARICSAGHGGQTLLSPSTAALVMNSLPEGQRLRDLGEHRLKDLSYPEHLFQLDLPGHPTNFPPLKSLNAMPNNLPAQLTSFVGREKEIEKLKGLLQEARLVSIIGPGGTGKSRLALQAGASLIDKFPDGVWFVELGSLITADEIPSAIANVLRFRIDTYASKLSPANQVVDYLSSRGLLLILDNFEHLLAGADFLKKILADATKVRLLLTSRERLNIPEEWVLALGGLEYSTNGHKGNSRYSSLELFLERARQSTPNFSLSPEERSYVNKICRLLGGSPLGIELAAPWTALLPCREIFKELEKNLDFLTDTFRSMPEGHRSVRAVFDHSWKRLNQVERSAFANLSVFQGGFERIAAQHVADVNLPMLLNLVNKSLVGRNEEERFQMHPLLHQFAAEKLKEGPDQKDSIREKHCRYYLDMLEKWQTSRPGDAWQEVLQKMLRENSNITDAIRWALFHWDEVDAEQVLEIASEFFMAQGFNEARLANQSLAQFLQENGARLDKGAPKQALLLTVTIGRAIWGVILGDLSEISVLQEYLSVLRDLDLKFTLGICLYGLGINAVNHSDWQEAIQFFEDAYLLLKETRSPESTAGCLIWFGWAYLETGDHQSAKKCFEEAYRLSEEHGVGILRPYTLDKLALWADTIGNFKLGMQYHQQALEILQNLGGQFGAQGYALSRLSLSAWGLDNYEKALDYSLAGAEMFERVGHRWGRAVSQCRIGFAKMGLENYDEAQEHFIRGLKLSKEYQVPGIALSILAGLGSLYTHQERLDQAVEVLTFVAQDPRTPGIYRSIAKKALEKLPTSLGDDRFAVDQELGRTLELIPLVDELISIHTI